MNASDFALIESQLEVLLPTVFKAFMTSFPNDAQHRLQNDWGDLPSNAELFAIWQLQRVFNRNGFDYYELQPQLRSRRFIEIGGDSCGNSYLMPGDDPQTEEVWQWEHDPPTGLRRYDDYSLVAYFGPDWRLESQPDPFAELAGTFIIRTDHPVRSILMPILMDEWIACVEQHPSLALDEHYGSKDPFTQKAILFRRWPGRAKLVVGDASFHISYLHGALQFAGSPPPKVMPELAKIAAGLNAKIWQRTSAP